MRQLSVTLTDEEYEYAKQYGNLWLRDIVQMMMEAGYDGNIPSYIFPPMKPEKRRWWRW